MFGITVNLVRVMSVMENVFLCNFFADRVYFIFFSRVIRFVIFGISLFTFLLQERFSYSTCIKMEDGVLLICYKL